MLNRLTTTERPSAIRHANASHLSRNRVGFFSVLVDRKLLLDQLDDHLSWCGVEFREIGPSRKGLTHLPLGLCFSSTNVMCAGADAGVTNSGPMLDRVTN